MTSPDGSDYIGSAAHELQAELIEFADLSSTEEREAELPELVAYASQVATTAALQQILANGPTTSYELATRRAITRTLVTPFMVNQNRIIPWVGNYTITAIDLDGQLLAAQTRPAGRVYENHDWDLYPTALSKSIIELHLSLAGQLEGVIAPNNRRKIAGLLAIPEEEVFLGAIATHSNAPIIFGASGCEFNSAYMNSLLPADMHDRYSANLYAGRADYYFAQITGNYFESGANARPEPEPEFMDLIRSSN